MDEKTVIKEKAVIAPSNRLDIDTDILLINTYFDY